MKDQEQEVKFYVADLAGLERKLQALEARPVQERIHELNLRFDNEQGELDRSFQALRLRRDSQARLTYKGPGHTDEGVRVRREIEFTVGDFDAAQAFLEALGYEIILVYEKYRAVYDLDGVDVTLDELPYGTFAELEGPDPGSIRVLADRLGLDWERRVPVSYTELFRQAQTALGLDFRDLTFANFAKVEAPAKALGWQAADEE